jgi:hypothetical protein
MHNPTARLSTRRNPMSRFIRSSTAMALAGVLAAAVVSVDA